MGAFPLIGIPTGKIIAEKASSGIGNTHGPVNKAFYFHVLRDLFPDFLYFRKGKLSGGNHSFGSLLPPETVGHVIGIVSLGGNMDFNLRPFLPGKGKHAGIRDNQRIRLYFL